MPFSGCRLLTVEYLWSSILLVGIFVRFHVCFPEETFCRGQPHLIFVLKRLRIFIGMLVVMSVLCHP